MSRFATCTLISFDRDGEAVFRDYDEGLDPDPDYVEVRLSGQHWVEWGCPYHFTVHMGEELSEQEPAEMCGCGGITDDLHHADDCPSFGKTALTYGEESRTTRQ